MIEKMKEQKQDRGHGVIITALIGLLLSLTLLTIGLHAAFHKTDAPAKANSLSEASHQNKAFDGETDGKGKSNDTAKQLEKREHELEERQHGGYGSQAQSYAPEGSQTNPKTDIARAYWGCSPQSLLDETNFIYQLSDDQSEMTLRINYPSQFADYNIGCLATNLNLRTTELTSEGTPDHGWRKHCIDSYCITSRIMNSGTLAPDGSTGWIDVIIKEQNPEGGYDSSIQ